MSSQIDYKERIAFSQVYDVLMLLNEDDRKKVPKKFIEFIKQNRSKEYISTINPFIPLKMQKLEEQAKAIISYIYIKYLSDENEKTEFREKEKREYEEEKVKIENIYEDMFNSKLKEPYNSNENIENKMTIKKEESFLQKLKNKLMKFLRLKK